MKNKTFSFTISFLLVIFQLFSIQNLAFAQSLKTLQVLGKDTVAGYGTMLSATTTSSESNITFYVKKPDQSIIPFIAKTDSKGFAKVELPENHTYVAGKYFVAAVLQSGEKSKPSTFLVYPQKVDAKESSLSFNRTLAKADGNDYVQVTVRLVDQFQNPFLSHEVKLVSTRPEDVIVSNNSTGLTNEKGEITFRVSSSKVGVSTYMAIDATANLTLEERPQVAFVNQLDYMTDAGGSFDFINVAKAAAGTLHHFELTDFPQNIQPNQNVSFKVNALDENNQLVQNYTGKIHFSAEGDNSNNVTLPEDYSFKAEDLGSHQFSLGLNFTTGGTYKIVVNDLDNPLIKGEKTLTVGSSVINNSNQQNQLKPVIETPAPGTYSQKTQTINGSAPAGLTVKIFDNQQEIGTVQANSSGKFSFETSTLADGAHNVYVITLDSNQTVLDTSDTVQFTVDSSPPEVDELTFTPDADIKANQVLTLQLKSEENLVQAAAILGSDIIELNPSLDKPGVYIGSVQTPSAPGVYPIDIILVDQLGNESSFKAKAQITITENGGSATVEETPETTPVDENPSENPPEEIPVIEEPVKVAPSIVTGLLSYASDKKITLVWDSATDDGTIKNYRVYYGVDADNLEEYVDTKDASITWYVPNLTNGKTYYFAVTAIDDQGLESEAKSTVVSGIPFATETSTLPQPQTPVKDAGGEDELHGAAVPDKVNESGPELLLLFSGAGFASTLVLRLKKKK